MLWKDSPFCKLRLKGAELIPVRQVAVPQQKADLLKRCLSGKVMDVKAPIGQHPMLPIDETDGRGGSNHIL
tara:strand:- start:2 stop:214 length:213 start_codon:yes stop_codon:yes gene_type:complete